jgi:zinc protease
MRILASLALVPGLVLAQTSAPTPAPTKVTSVEGITEYRLANGLQVLLFPDNSKPTVTVNVTYMVGSRFEGYGETGMAHLLEHLMFKGTMRHGEILAELNAHGAVSENGSTDYDRTNYYETLNATDENLRWALDMEADRMVNSRIARTDLDSEMTVVRNEFERDENSVANVLEERVLSTAYLWHSYGRSPIGSRSDIEKVPIDALQAFYRKYYQPDNAMLVVAGKIDPAKTLGWINEIFGALPKPTRKLTPTYTEEPAQDGEREVVLRRTGGEQIEMMAYHIPASGHPDVAAIEVLMELMGDRTSGRLHKALVETKKAVSATADENMLHDPGYMMFSARLRKEGSLDDVEKTLQGVIDGVVKEPPSKDEVDRARTRLLNATEQSLKNSSRVGLNLSEWGSMGDWRLLFLNRDRVERVTPEDVARVAKLYLKPSNRTTGKFIPEDAPDRTVVPATPDVEAALRNYTGKAAVEDGEAFDPTPANIEARVQRITLPSGIKLVLMPKKNRGGVVTAQLELHFGDEKSLFGKSTAASMAEGLLGRGTAKHTRQQLQDEMDRLKIQVRVGGGGGRGGGGGSVAGANASITASRATLADALRLAAEELREPSFPESDFEQSRQAALARLETSRTDPQAIATEQRARYVAPYPAGDPRATMTAEERMDALKKVTLDDAKKFYADFYGASNAELVVIGDFDSAEVQKLTGELFGNWKSPAPYKEISRTWQKLTPVERSTETPDKTNAYFTLVSTMAMNQDDPDYLAMVLVDTMTGGDEKSRLWVRVREKEGLSYSVSSSFNAGTQEKFASFTGAAICAPENIAKVEAAFKEELAKVVRDGFTQAELDSVKKEILDAQQAGRAQDTRLATALATQARYGWTMQRTEDREKKIAALTLAQVNAAAKKWIDPASFAIFKAGDFAKK